MSLVPLHSALRPHHGGRSGDTVSPNMDATKLRWVAVIVPVVAIGVLDLVTDHEWSDLVTSPANTLAVPVIGLALAVVFARVAFGRIDALGNAIRERSATLERRNASLEALRSISAAVATGGRIDDIFGAVTASARDLVRADSATITLRGGPAAERIAAATGDHADVIMLTTHSAPLLRGDAAIGSLIVRWQRPNVELGHEEGELLDALANQAAVAIERDRLRGELRELAIRGERERIAREMHDGLAQVLGYVNTKALAAEELLANDRPADARRQLAELSAAARSVYVDVREAILGLTSPIAVEGGLAGAIEEYVARFASAAKIAATVTATAEARDVQLTPETQVEVFRVVREALTNVRKHASAHRVSLDLSTRDGALLVRVTDDGVGIEAGGPASRDWPHYGMRMMRERAEAMGAAVSWASAPAGGTVFDLRVPLVEQAVTP